MYKQRGRAMERISEIARLKAAIESACRTHDDAGRRGEDQLPYKERISDLRVDLARLEAKD